MNPRHAPAVALLLVTAGLLASCTPSVDETAARLSESQALTDSIYAALRQENHEPFGGLAGVGDQSTASAIEISGQRDRLSVYAECSGAEGEAEVRVADQASATMTCGVHPDLQVLYGDVVVKGNRLTVEVRGAPAGSAWAIVACAPRDP